MTKLTRQEAIDEAVRRVYTMWSVHRLSNKRFMDLAITVSGEYTITWWVREEFRQIMASQ